MTKTHTVPAGTMATMNTKGTTYFTPMDTLDDHIELDLHARLRSPILQSMIWIINTTCKNLATSIMFDLYGARSADDKPTMLVDYGLSIAENLDRDEIYNGTMDENRTCEIESNENTLAMLLGIRQKWYEQAYAAMNGTSMSVEAMNKWTEKERFSISLAKADSAEISSEEIAMMKFDVSLLTKDPVELEHLLAEKIKTTTVAREQDNKSKLELAPIKMQVLTVVGRHLKHDARFDQLPLRTQQMITNFTIGAIDRSKEDLRKRMAKKEGLAYTQLSLAAFRAVKELEYVMKAKYHNVTELEAVSTTTSHEQLDKARNAKAFACID